MNQQQRVLHHLLGLGTDEEATSQRILQLDSCKASDEEIAAAIEQRVSEIMRCLPGPQFVPLMIPIQKILTRAGEELRRQRQQRPRVARRELAISQGSFEKITSTTDIYRLESFPGGRVLEQAGNVENDLHIFDQRIDGCGVSQIGTDEFDSQRT